jgi:cyclopropane fatty-acyl-phospholipid synthase-like methyltransferase
MKESLPPSRTSYYSSNYKTFQSDLYAEIRREAFGEDIGQNSWLTADEQDRFIGGLELSPEQTLLDIACGSGGPVLRIAEKTGCPIIGIDVEEDGIRAAALLAAERGLTQRVQFQCVDANRPLPLQEDSFDAITCIDAINHFRDRVQTISEWQRLLKPGGRLLFTDPIIVTGPLSSEEIAIRSSAGFYLYVPNGYTETVLERCGLRLLRCEDVTANMAQVAASRHAARACRSIPLRQIEGDELYTNQQNFLQVAARLAEERRLSRFVYVCKKAG